MRGRVLCILLTLLPVAHAWAQTSLGLSYVETKDLRLIYFDQLGYLAPHAVRTFTNSLEWQRRTFGWVPSEATTVLLADLSDYGNASTWSAPHNTAFFSIAPLSHAFETYPASERMYSLMNHELVHVVQGDIANDEDRRWRRFFLGKVSPQSQHPESLLYSYLTVPRFTTPRWYSEGGAVFMETWMDGGLGRAQGGYDEMVFRAMVRDDAHFYDALGLVSRGVQVDFQITSNAYLYGTRFFTYLAYTYSPEKVVGWIRRDEDSARYYADNFQRVFGLPLEQAWQDWIKFEHEFQRGNLAELRRHPITPYRTLAGHAMGSISRMYFDEKAETIYAAFRYPGFVEHVGALNTRDGTERRLADIKRAMLYRVSSFAYDGQTGTAFFTNDNLAYRDLMSVDVHTGEERMLLKDARIGEIAFNPIDRSLMGVRHADGLASLVRIPYPYSEWQLIYTFPYESVPYDLDISADGRLLSASMSEVSTEQYLRVWELDKILKGDIKPLSEFRFGQSVPESFVFSRDGRYLYGSSYYTGVSNIFRYEVATGEVEAVSNAEVGFFRPVPLADGRLVVLAYTGAGFVPAMIDPKLLKDVSAIKFLGAELAEKYPIVKSWQVPSPTTVDPDKIIVDKGDYRPLSNVSLENAFPVLQGYKNQVGAGYQFNFEDPIRFANFGVTAAYTPAKSLEGSERGHVDITGNYLGLKGELSWNRSNFYDLFGPTIRSRKGYAAKLAYDWLVVYDEPRKLTITPGFEYFDKIDTLPTAQNVQTTFTRLMTGKLGINYTDVRRSLGAVDEEQGIAAGAQLDVNGVEGKTIPLLRGNVDVGFALPIGHSSIWLRSAAGVASGDRANPVASFYFGAFGNNYVDDGNVKRYREYYALPGFDIDQLTARSFVREMVEWNLPPIVFESAGSPGFYLNWIRPAVFGAALFTDPGKSTSKNYGSIGTQADLRFSVLHWYETMLSLGFAIGLQGTKRVGSEWMVSLKIM
ncbi:MAG TPA: hypothetical protein VGK44_03415 [Casimicrobiaceae bacterium]|jgi:hypothetical protein